MGGAIVVGSQRVADQPAGEASSKPGSQAEGRLFESSPAEFVVVEWVVSDMGAESLAVEQLVGGSS
jgi:hypothetical protein